MSNPKESSQVNQTELNVRRAGRAFDEAAASYAADAIAMGLAHQMFDEHGLVRLYARIAGRLAWRAIEQLRTDHTHADHLRHYYGPR